jgi:hypothetical protein
MMVQSGIEQPPEATTQTSPRTNRKRRGKPGTSATSDRPDGLAWDQFRDLYYPNSRRHNLAAIVAYGEYRRTPLLQAGSEAGLPEQAAAADAESSLGEWEDEGGALRYPSGGG